MPNNVLYASTIILADATTKGRVAIAVNNLAWTILLQLGANPLPRSDENVEFARRVVRNPTASADPFLWALASHEPVATQVLTDYVAAGDPVDIPVLLRSSIQDDVIKTVTLTVWPELAAI